MNEDLSLEEIQAIERDPRSATPEQVRKLCGLAREGLWARESTRGAFDGVIPENPRA